MIPDNELMFEVKHGNLDKLSLLYERYNRVLFSYFYRMTSNRDLCEDLVQNVFFRIIKYRKKFKGYGKFTSWLFHIARNVRNDHYRKSKFSKNIADIYEVDLIDEDNPVKNTERKEQSLMIRKALNELTSEQREVIILSRYHDMKYRDIANIISCTENAVKARIFRAIEKLRDVYRKMEN